MQFTESESAGGSASQAVRSREITSEAKIAKLPQLSVHEDESVMIPTFCNLPEPATCFWKVQKPGAASLHAK